MPVRAYNHHSPKRANTKAAHIDLSHPSCMAMSFSTPCTCFDHFDHVDLVAVRCETSEATPVVAKASEAPCNEIVIVLSITPNECYFMCHTCACMHQYLPAYLPANVCACVINLAPSQGRGSSTHRVCVSVCVCVCVSVTVLAGATGT